MALTAGLATPLVSRAVKSFHSSSAHHRTAAQAITLLKFPSKNAVLGNRNTRRHNAVSGREGLAVQWAPAGVRQSGFTLDSVCLGCQRQGLGLGLGAGLRRASRRGPVAQAGGKQEGTQAGAFEKGSNNGASGSNLTAAPPLSSSERFETPHNRVHSPNGRSTGGDSTSDNSPTSSSAMNGKSEQSRNGASIATFPPSKTTITPSETSQMPPSTFSILALPKRLWRRTLRGLSSLSLAIGILLTVAGCSALGTVIEQNKNYKFYIDNYPEENPALGFLSWKVLLDWELDHIYTSWWFLSLLVLLAASLMACTSTRQLPMAKVARRWRFMKSKAQFRDMDVLEELPRAKAADLVAMLGTRGYEVFMKGPSVYAFKGLAGKLGPIGVHFGLILTMAGCAYSATAGFEGSSMTPQGQEFFIGDILKPVGFLSRMPAAEQFRVHVNNFNIDYMPNGNVNQFYSDLSIVDLNDNEVYHKMIKVNDPLRYSGVTMYQTDWNLASLQARVDGGAPFRLPMAILDDGVGKTGKLFGTFLRTGPAEEPRGVSLVARDFLSVAVYGPDGSFVGVRRPGSNKPITVDGKSIVIEELIGATGMQLKYDPGVPFVYAGFGTLIITVIVSQVSHDQLWALEEGGALIVGARSSKNKQALPSDLDYLFNALPEYLPSEENGQHTERATPVAARQKAVVSR